MGRTSGKGTVAWKHSYYSTDCRNRISKTCVIWLGILRRSARWYPVRITDPTLDALENTLGSLLARRESAALIMHFSPLELAQRVYYTVSLLHLVLVRDRQRHRIIQDMDANSVAWRFLCLQGEHDRLKQEFVFLYEYLQQEVQSVQNEAANTRCLLEADFAHLARENLEETATLRQRVGDLESQLRYAQTQIAFLKGQVRESKFDAYRLLAFLNGGNNEVRGNWPRFRRLLGQFRRGVSPPSSWKAWITVEAACRQTRDYFSLHVSDWLGSARHGG